MGVLSTLKTLTDSLKDTEESIKRINTLQPKQVVKEVTPTAQQSTTPAPSSDVTSEVLNNLTNSRY